MSELPNNDRGEGCLVTMKTQRSEGEPRTTSWQAPPRTTEEYLQHIEAIGVRIHGRVQFMCQVGNLNGASLEAKDKAVAAFHERMIVLERQLARIQEELQLG